jgi:hypothetical protein
MPVVTFVETSVFTRRIAGILDDDSFADFQTELARNPEKGPVLEGTGGLRKARWKLPGKGKSGGIRIIYLHLKLRGRIYLVFVFAKDESDNLTASQKAELKKLVEAIKKEFRK